MNTSNASMSVTAIPILFIRSHWEWLAWECASYPNIGRTPGICGAGREACEETYALLPPMRSAACDLAGDRNLVSIGAS